MPFLTIEFAVFFLIFFSFYWSLRRAPSVQNELLIIVSLGLLWYLNGLFLLSVLFFTTVLAVIVKRMRRATSSTARKRWLIYGVVFAVCNLSFFKYFDNLRPALHDWLGHDVIDLLLPLGLSYYTFQGIAYLAACYRQLGMSHIPPDALSCRLSYFELLLHFSFFPTITAGPIARAAPMKHINGQHVGMAIQIKTHKQRVVLRPALALSLMLLGVAKVWWFAGSLGDTWVEPIFDNPLQYDRASLLLAIYGYTLELFLNFSGYSDLVIGMAMLLGFQLPPNFAQPLRAYNIRDFWNRWHISLSTWIRDYLYIPLGGSRCGFWRAQLHVLIAMVLSGIWHGNGWPFIIWGLLHGLALIWLNGLEKLTGKRDWLSQSILGKGLAILLTLSFVAFSFIFFRAQSMDDVWLMGNALAHNTLPLNHDALYGLALLLCMLLGYSLWLWLFNHFVALLESLPVWLWVIPLALVMMIVVVCAPSGIPGFIYANF